MLKYLHYMWLTSDARFMSITFLTNFLKTLNLKMNWVSEVNRKNTCFRNMLKLPDTNENSKSKKKIKARKKKSYIRRQKFKQAEYTQGREFVGQTCWTDDSSWALCLVTP